MKKIELSGAEVLAIDAGTQALSTLLWCPERKIIVSSASARYEHPYIPGLGRERLEQMASYWSNALAISMNALRSNLKLQHRQELKQVAAIGITGHMHSLVRLAKDDSKPWGCVMWNDPRGVKESRELTEIFSEHIPSRWSACRILSSMRMDPEEWRDCAGVTVPSGSLLHDLSGAWALGPGEASGMFGTLDGSGQISKRKLEQIDNLVGNRFTPLENLVPKVVAAGSIAGYLNENGSKLLGGLPVGTPIAPPEGDQSSALVVSAAQPNELALSAGSSFTGNMACTECIIPENETVNILASPDLLTQLMVCVRNGMHAFTSYVHGIATLNGHDYQQTEDRLTDLANDVDPDCNGAFLLPFMQGENVVDLPYARGELSGMDLHSVENPGVMARLLLEGPCHTLRYGLKLLEKQACKVKGIILSGSALNSKDGFAPQLFADLLGFPVRGRKGDNAGPAKGAAILAAYMLDQGHAKNKITLAEFAKKQIATDEIVWRPDEGLRDLYNARYKNFEESVKELQKNRPA